MSSEKLQKVMARAGLCSRRQAETLIEAGRVSINGSIATLGARVEPKDTIRVDGKILKILDEVPTRVIAYYKPDGEISTQNDPQGRPTVFEHLPSIKNGRWVQIGRLDINTQGLLLFTNDGEMANRLMHPSSEIEREYAVRVFGEVTDQMLDQLKSGVALEDGVARFDVIIDQGGEGINHWYHVILREGRQREVRRLWESQGVKVSRLIRVRYGTATLPRGLAQGRWIELTVDQINALRQSVDLPVLKSIDKKSLGQRQPNARRRIQNRVRRR